MAGGRGFYRGRGPRARLMASADLTARFSGAGGVAVRLRTAAASVGPETRRAVGEAGEESVFIFRVKAPYRTGRLRREIRSRVSGDTATVAANPRSSSGFPYVGVTRFGHRVRSISARPGRFLRFVVGGRVLFRKQVRGYRPAGDWRDLGLPAAERTVQAAGARAGQRIVARVG